MSTICGTHDESVDPDIFKQAMSAICTPVSVVTALQDERPYGTTVSAFASLSLEPAMVVVALDRASRLLGVARATRRIGVNVLSSDQSATALTFATKGDEKFRGVEWRVDDGLPRLEDASVWLVCSVDDFVDGGDHILALARVHSAEMTARRPLTYYRRQFSTPQELLRHA